MRKLPALALFVGLTAAAAGCRTDGSADVKSDYDEPAKSPQSAPMVQGLPAPTTPVAQGLPAPNPPLVQGLPLPMQPDPAQGLPAPLPATADNFAGKTYCRSIGRLGGGRAQLCITFAADGTATEPDTSTDIRGHVLHYTYVVTDDVPQRLVLTDTSSSKDSVFSFSPGLNTISEKEGPNSFVFTLRR